MARAGWGEDAGLDAGESVSRSGENVGGKRTKGEAIAPGRLEKGVGIATCGEKRGEKTGKTRLGERGCAAKIHAPHLDFLRLRLFRQACG